MNMDSIKNELTKSFYKGELTVKKYSPEILLGAGVVGVLATIVMVAKASTKIEGVVTEAKEAIDRIEDAASVAKKTEGVDTEAIDSSVLKSKATVYAVTGLRLTKLYAPSVGIGVLSLTSILASHGIMKNRQIALAAAYNLVAEGYKQYRARVTEELGADVDNLFHNGLKSERYSETVKDEDGKNVKVKKTRVSHIDTPHQSIYGRYFDRSSRMYRTSRLLNKAFLEGQERYLNDILMIRGYVFLNEAYEALGLPWSPEGQLVGWVLKDPEQMKAEGRDGYISFDIKNVYNDPNDEFVNELSADYLLDFNVDGVVYDLI